MPDTVKLEKQWTVIVYLAGDNNLSSAGEIDLSEMKQVGSTNEINIVAQFDRADAGAQTSRYLLQKGTALENDKVMDLGETNMGDPMVLDSFAKWAIQQYPAKHYLLVLWNHGSGWDDTDIYRLSRGLGLTVQRRGATLASAGGNLPSAPVSSAVSATLTRRVATSRFRRALFATSVATALKKRAIAFDDQAQDFLDNIEMKRVLKGVAQSLGRKLDILGMDACLMSMVEVAQQVRDCANWMVGSEEVEPTDGWPYHQVLAKLAAKPSMTPEALSKLIVKEYLASYSSQDAVTQSALDLAQIDPLTQAVQKLGLVLLAGLKTVATRDAITLVRDKVQAYRQPDYDYVDLLDLCALLKAQAKNKAITQACEDVVLAAKGFVAANGHKGVAVKNSQGISIYFPERTVSSLYATLDFTHQKGWDEFLYGYVLLRKR